MRRVAPQGSARDRGRRPGRVSLAFLLVVGALSSEGCGSPGANNCDDLAEPFFAGIAKTSSGGVTMKIVSAEPAPPANSDRNAWTVELTDVSTGAALEGATLIVAPYMPEHGHGAPNIIATESGGGSYRLSPIYLKMTGLWDVTLKATPAGGVESRVVFPFCIPPR